MLGSRLARGKRTLLRTACGSLLCAGFSCKSAHQAEPDPAVSPSSAPAGEVPDPVPTPAAATAPPRAMASVRAPASRPEPRAKAAAPCDDRVASAAAALDAALGRARKPCDSAADCVAHAPALGCFGTCPASVSRAARNELERAVAAADQRYCRDFRAECPGRWATPRCLFGPVQCTDGQCAFEPPRRAPAPP